MRALVTGCCGFIGSNLVKRLLAEGWDVEGVDDLSNSDLGSVSSLSVRTVPADFLHIFEANPSLRPGQALIVTGDFTHPAVLRRIRTTRYDVVFHLAAQSSVPVSIKMPVETHETNVFKTLGLFQTCRGNVSQVVFASSAAVYGEPAENDQSIDESQPTRPLSPYGLQKLHVEQYAALLAGPETHFTCFRIFNAFGPGQRTGMIAEWCANILNGKSISIFGSGQQTRDFCYVDNIIDAFLAAVGNSRGMQIYNVGTGISTSVNEIGEHLKKIFPSVIFEHTDPRAGDITHSRADISKISKELGYNPRVQLEQGLHETLKWWTLNEK